MRMSNKRRRMDVREVAGQVMRLALVIPGTLLDQLPEGTPAARAEAPVPVHGG